MRVDKTESFDIVGGMNQPPSTDPYENSNEQPIVSLTLSLKEWQRIPWNDRGITFEGMESPKAWMRQNGKLVRVRVENIYD